MRRYLVLCAALGLGTWFAQTTARADFAPGVRVPIGTAPNQTLKWNAATFSWVLDTAEPANTVLAGPTSGNGTPSFRGLVNADLPVPLVLTASGPGVTPLTIKGASGQTVNLLNFSSATGTGDLLAVDKNGSLNIGNQSSYGAALPAGTLQSGRYILGGDLGLFPSPGGNSTVMTYWGLQLMGNTRATPTFYSGVSALTVASFHVLIKATQPSVPILITQEVSGQSADPYQLLGSDGTTILAKQSASGSLTTPAVLTAIATKTASYTLTATDTTILLSGAGPIALPAASASLAGHVWTIKEIGTAPGSITGTVDGAAGYILSNPMQYVTITSDGTSYYKTGGN